MTALGRVSRYLAQTEEDRLYFACRGLRIAQGVSHENEPAPRWGEWELGRADVHAEHSGPIHLVGQSPGSPFGRDRRRIQFLDDCTHHLAGRPSTYPIERMSNADHTT